MIGVNIKKFIWNHHLVFELWFFGDPGVTKKYLFDST